MKRLILATLLVGLLLLLVASSQWHQEPLHVSGIIESDEIRLGSRVGGRVAEVLVQEGQAVRRADVLVRLEAYDLREREAELEFALAARAAEYARVSNGFREEEQLQAKAKLDQLQARLELLQAGPRREEIEAARGDLTLALAEQRLANQTNQRLSKLAAENAISKQELDIAREGLAAATAKVSVSEQKLRLLELGTRDEELREAAASVEQARQAWQLTVNGYRPEEIAQAAAARDAAQAALEAIRRQKEELEIRSPIDGVIEALDLQPGDMVAPGAPVLSMLDQNDLWVRAYVPQNRAPLELGQRLKLTVDSHERQTCWGNVVFIARQAEFTPSNVQTPEERSKQVFRIKVAIEQPLGQLRPGMIVDVWLEAGDAAP